MHTAPPWPGEQPGELLRMCCGNADAARLVSDLARISHVYDDLIDGDKPKDDAAVHEAMWKALIDIPSNAFFLAHRHAFLPILATGILNWRAANDMQASGCAEQLHIAHALRYSIADALMLAMLLTGGPDHAAKHAHRARLMGQQDTWAHYCAEHSGGQPCR